VLTFRFAVVHSLPSAIRVKDAIVPDRFWSVAGSSVEQAAATHASAMLSASATTLRRLSVMLSSPAWSIAVWENDVHYVTAVQFVTALGALAFLAEMDQARVRSDPGAGYHAVGHVE
jgi:hypothetical protein